MTGGEASLTTPRLMLRSWRATEMIETFEIFETNETKEAQAGAGIQIPQD